MSGNTCSSDAKICWIRVKHIPKTQHTSGRVTKQRRLYDINCCGTGTREHEVFHGTKAESREHWNKGHK